MTLDARIALIALVAWGAAVIVHGFGRSFGAAAQDPIRPSGPIVRRGPFER